jgi:hypothetical protein
MPLVSYDNHVGDPIQVGDVKITPIARALHIQLPIIKGGFIWNRPASMVVQTGEGEEQVMPVVDVTRLAQVLLLGVGLFGGLLIWALFRRGRV